MATTYECWLCHTVFSVQQPMKGRTRTLIRCSACGSLKCKQIAQTMPTHTERVEVKKGKRTVILEPRRSYETAHAELIQGRYTCEACAKEFELHTMPGEPARCPHCREEKGVKALTPLATLIAQDGRHLFTPSEAKMIRFVQQSWKKIVEFGRLSDSMRQAAKRLGVPADVCTEIDTVLDKAEERLSSKHEERLKHYDTSKLRRE